MINFDILVNKNNPLDSNYIPVSLTITDQNENNFHNYVDANLKPRVASLIFPFILIMQEEAKKQGFNIIVDSGYRSYEYQLKIYEDIVKKKGKCHADKFVALPGTSEHQTGLAIDIAYIKDGIYTDDVKETDDEFIWLSKNAHKFGFILRYPKDKENITGYSFEPWHFRFVGIPLSEYLYKNNLTLEEYHQELKLKRKKVENIV